MTENELCLKVYIGRGQMHIHGSMVTCLQLEHLQMSLVRSNAKQYPRGHCGYTGRSLIISILFFFF